MSLFLGKIHYWLYNKIRIQEALAKRLVEGLDMEAMIEELDRELGQIPQGDLEDFIDTSNIHSSLQDLIRLSQNRLAKVLARVLEEAREEEAGDLAQELGLGLQKDIEKNRELKYYYDILDSLILSGMPCDNANEIILEDGEKLIYRTREKVYASHYPSGELKKLYKELRVRLGQGIFTNIGIEVLNLEEDYYLLRRV